ncbi:MAG TPA: FAD binding domain-containing protein [Bellilinea sp.]|nr:FAD binding domain-containing protein [Bellilinea sp.]
MATPSVTSPIPNSHIVAQKFDYYDAASIDEAITLKDTLGQDAKFLAGGTDLMIMMKMEREHPKSVIYIGKVPGLDEVKVLDDGSLSIGALTTIYNITRHPWIKERYPVLSEAAASFGSSQIEAMGTIGGNIANGSPAADTPPALLTLGATVVLRSKSGERTMPLEDFFLAPGKTAIKAGEILTAVVLPPAPDNSTSTFMKMTRVVADLAKVSLGLSIVRDGDKITDVKVGMGAVAPKPIRLPKTEAMLRGKKYSASLIEKAAVSASEEITPISDVRSTAEYRRKVTKAMFMDAFEVVWGRKVKAFKPLKKAPVVGTNVYESSHSEVKSTDCSEIEFTLNGKPTKVRVQSNDLLLNVLRNDLQLTGTKYACGIGECSACTVDIDGKPMLSCLILAPSVAGKDVVTIEGLADPATGKLNKLQESFIEETGFQCGYCTPGMIMTAEVLLKEVPKPSEAEIRNYMRGNFCRCTGYASIVRSIQTASKK